MKKGKLLNAEISSEIAKLGHKQTITIADAGLPITNESKRIDLCLTQNIPRFLDVLLVVLEEMHVEKIIIAREMSQYSQRLYKEISKKFEDVEIQQVSHEDFKDLTMKSKAIIRTGETTPYANIILVSGVTF